ncbi:VWA domain-containing protein [Granulicella mallensis]|uniref:VWFA-related domain-containing protein n=1 Tax=Granulicella mallensis (strain ATCC BAA-1857 / DSM 23137 / MP5ACTX8) TaxID=682795 RepID=G8NT88_GRAMM|nr:VWA domain-containing protein [Granulicella mallensis]AEU38600.1 VWFA-related domain-containing protein [Granulicella mallensis MP5ACTX8]
MRRLVAALTVVGLGLGNPMGIAAQNAPQQNSQGQYTMTVNANIVLTNVVVRDKKTGELVKGLKASDFHIVEDKKAQTIASFDYQNVDQAAVLAEKTTATGKASIADLLENNFAASPKQLHDHRLIVMFFDLSSMQDEDIDRAVDAANDYVNKKMEPADLVALVSMSTGLTMDQDFTNDKAALLKGLAKYNGSDETGFANGGTGSTDGTSDDTTAFAADDTEYNSLNTDRELLAIRAISKSLERVDQRKSMLYFSGGLTRNGIENQASLRAATNEAAKANLAIYSVDTRGLQALPPVGDASKGSLRGNSAYSGAAVTAQFSANYGSQETLSTLSADTGGKAFFDSNDFGPAFQQVQHDTEAYYILGFHSTNQAHDGTFRHLTITVNRKDVKIDFRPGYFAPADFQHQKTEDRELALTEQMRSDLPATDVAVYLQALYFRQSENLFYVPVSLLVPGSQIPFEKNGERDKASLDILGQVRNGQGIAVGNVRDTVKLALDQSQQVQRKNIQYSTGFSLAPGKYHLKFVVRENQTGNLGSFETDINVPDLKKVPLKLSSVVLASQRTPNTVKNSKNLLVRDGLEWVPNVAHVFRQDQHLYFLYEVYDPSRQKGAAEPAASPGLGRREGGPVHVLTSIEFLSGGTKVYETPLVTANIVNTPDRGAVAFQFDVPLAQLKAGTYICQVNVIDDADGSFSFPRIALRVTPAAVTATPVDAPKTPAQ